MRKIIIDTDPGIDDAVAIALAVRSSKLDVKLITTIAGNVDVDKTTNNALKLMEFFNSDIPVAKGFAKPLLKKLENAADIHGETGMAGYDFPEPSKKILPIHAVEALRETILKSSEKITLVPIAALTNIAVLLSMYPEVKDNIDEIVMMGGSLSGGNTNTMAEFNIYVDPHAASIVFQSGVKINMVGLDVTRQAVLHHENSLKIKESGKVGEMFYSMFQHYRGGSLKNGLRVHDACAIAFLLKPDLFETKECYVEVVTEGVGAGALVADGAIKKNADKKPNINVCTQVNSAEFENWIVNEFRK